MEHNGYYSSDDRLNRQRSGNKNEGRGGNAFATIVIIIVVVLLALLIVGLFWPRLLGGEELVVQPTATPTQEIQATPLPTATPQMEDTVAPEVTATPYEDDREMPELDGVSPEIPGMIENPIPDIYDAVSPGVVGVINYVEALSLTGNESYEIYGSGTGFVVSSEGYILTNAHVVEDADKVTVKIDGEDEEREATVVGSDTETDIAVLKVEGVELQPLELGDSDSVRVGEYVLAIGNPLSTDELANTLTFGIISATSREITIDNYSNTYLQTDAAINFGNSGGPLINMDGKVIGINSAKTITAGYDEYGNAVSAEGIGFALPINQVKKIMEILITVGYVERPGIGITVGTITQSMAEESGIPIGAYVESVVKDRPADLAGLMAGDIIVEANGKTINDQEELVNLVLGCMIGDELYIKVYRDGEYLDLTIVIGNKSDMDFDDIVGNDQETPAP
jgi:serine protease Do